jgi:CRISPR-associated endonuclease Cas2
VVVFDIPEPERKKRNLIRNFLKRKDFYMLQRSVFISPFADFDELNFIRNEYKVDKFVNIFRAESASIDDDSALKKYFNL